MDSCQRFKEMVSDYIEGGLDHQHRLLMEQHLRECLGCNKTAGQLKNLIQNLKGLPKITVSPDFETILRARISLESSLARRRRENLLSLWQFRWPAFAVATILLILALATIFRRLDKSQHRYPPEALINQEWYGGTQPVNPSSHDRIIYFMERKPIYNVYPHRPVFISPDQSLSGNVSSDSTRVATNQNNLMKTNTTFEPSIY